MTFVAVCKTCMHDYDNPGCCAISVSFCLFISGVHCTKQDKTIIHTAEDFYHTASQAVMLYGKNLHSIAKQSSNFWSSDGRVQSPLQVFRRSTYPAMLNHINCLSGDSPLTLMEICHSWSRWWPDSRFDECKDAPATVASAVPLHIKFAHWVLVHFAGKKASGRGRQKWRWCDSIVKKSEKVFLWPNVEDISEVSWVNIVRKLSEPQCDKRGHLLFAEKMDDIYNIYWKEQFIIQFLYNCY